MIYVVFYLGIDLPEVIKCVAFCNCSGKDQISSDHLKLLDLRYNISKQCMFRS